LKKTLVHKLGFFCFLCEFCRKNYCLYKNREAGYAYKKGKGDGERL